MDNLNNTLRKPGRYWNADGFPEIGIGAAWVLLGAVFVAPEVFPHRPWIAVASAITCVLMMPAFFLLNRVLVAAKRRVTYPRAGYVKYRKPGRRVWFMGAAAGVILTTAMAFLIHSGADSILDTAAPMVTGCFIGVIFSLIGARFGQQRFYALAGLGFLLGFAMPVLHLGTSVGLPIIFMVLGAACLITGGVTLRRFLTSTEVQNHG
jgi:hypothetical protein